MNLVPVAQMFDEKNVTDNELLSQPLINHALPVTMLSCYDSIFFFAITLT